MDTDILGLPSLKALQVTENEYGDYRIMTETTSPSFSCPERGCGSPVIGFGKKEQLFIKRCCRYGNKVGSHQTKLTVYGIILQG